MGSAFSWTNYVDTATITNSTPGWLASPNTSTEVLGTAKLKTRQLSDIFRQTFAAITSPLPTLILDFDLGSAKETDLIAILNHNMAGMAYTLDFGTTSGGSEVGTETGTFWTGAADDAPNEMLYLSTSHTARYVRLTVNVTASPIDIGRIWLDNSWAMNVAMDFSVGIDDRSNKTPTPAGGFWADNKRKRRVLRCKAYGLNTEDVVGTDATPASFLAADVAIGDSGECILLPDTSSQRLRQMLGVYGHLSRNEAIEFIDKGSDGYISSKRFTVLEDF